MDSKSDLQRFIDKCENLKKRGHSEEGIAYAMGFNDVVTYHAFRAVIEKNLDTTEDE